MNIAMEQTEVGAAPGCPFNNAHLSSPYDVSEKLLQEYVNGQLKNKYGDAFIRGNNGARCLSITS